MTRVTALGVLFGLTFAGNVYGQQMIGSCPVLPANNIWNTPVDTLPVLSNSTSMVNTIGATRGFHADFGSGTWDGGPIGIPFITVAGSQTKYPASFLYADESDAGPVRRSARRANRRRKRINGRPPRDCGRHGSLHSVRALSRVSGVVGLDGGCRRDLQFEFERAASVDLDVRRRRRLADHARPRDLRRSAERRDQTRDPFHRSADHAASSSGRRAITPPR